jgi:pimeloyl-ACP methyl ester carboxylesterase
MKIALVFIFLLIATWMRYWFARREALHRIHASTHRIVMGAGTIEFALEGTGEPLLVIHGAGGGWDQALDMTQQAGSHGFQIIAPSRFGYLQSTITENFSNSKQAEAYVQLLDNLKVARASVIAISAGAWSALEFARLYPDRCKALILMVPADHLPTGVGHQGGLALKLMLASDFFAWCVLKLRAVFPAIYPLMMGTDARIVKSASREEKLRVAKTLDHLLPVSRRTTGMYFDIRSAASRIDIPFEEIQCPVLTVSAEDDLYGTATRAMKIAAAVPRGRHVIFKSGGHALVGQYEKALSVSIAFLREHQ